EAACGTPVPGDERLRAARRETHIIREEERTTETIAPAHNGLMLPEIDLFQALAWLRARWILIAALAIIGGLAGLAYGMTAKPRYTAYTDLLVPPSGLQLLPNDVYAQSLQADSQILDIESKMRVLTSGNVLRRVVTDLKLNEDEEFVPPPPAFDLRAMLGLAKPAGPTDDTLTAVRALSQRITVTRPERSYLVTIAVWTDN